MTRIGNCELHHIDCLEYMATLPDKAFDLAVVDPPYGIGADKAQNAAALSRIKADGNSKAGRGWKQYKETEWDAEIPTIKYWDELFRVSVNQIVWGGNYMTNFLPPSMGWIIWDKCQRDFSLADCELAWSSMRRAARIFDYSRGAALQDGRIHPTQKPVKLYEWLLTNYAKPGQRILDTHLGSGSSAIACNNLGFDLVGCELDADYYAAACKRIHQATAQERLFA